MSQVSQRQNRVGAVGTGFRARPALRRLGDMAIAGLALVALMPVAAVIAIVLAARGSPVLLATPTTGPDGRVFRRWSFPTLDARGQESAVFGVKLATSGLSDLPRLVNVLRGQMPLVASRP